MIDRLEQYDIKTPSLEAVDEFTIIDGKEVKVIRSPEMKEEPEPSIHHHNNLDQPSIDLTREVTGTILHSDLSGVTSDQHHAQLHAASHTSGGVDDLTGITLTNMVYNGGTATSLKLVTPTIGTMAATGGTATNLTLITPTIADFTNAIHAHTSNATGGTVSHTSLSNIGTNTHTQIDSHISSSGTTVHGLGSMSIQNIGANGTAVYIKTVDFGGTSVTSGTIIFTNGIATTIS